METFKHSFTRFALLTLASNLLLLALPAMVQAQDYTFTTNDGTITITGYTGPGGDVMIPSMINGLPVTSIADLSSGNITNVAIPATVTNISPFAFYGYGSNLTNITVDPLNSTYSSADGILFNRDQTTLIACPSGRSGSYTIPPSVMSIGYGAFLWCRCLTEIIIPDSVADIGEIAFENCISLTNVVIGNGVTNIGWGAFVGCAALSDVLIGGNVVTIGEEAFGFCSNLMGIVIPDSVVSLGGYAFYSCTNLTSVTIGESVTSIEERAFSECSILTSVTIGSSVTNIGTEAFYFCRSLTTIAIPDSVISIGSRAFFICSGLTNIVLGNSVTNIATDAFSFCSSLVTFEVNASNSFYSSMEGVLFDQSQTRLIQFPFGRGGSYAIPNSVTSIGDWAFSYCYNLTNITIGHGITSIGNDAFYSCGTLSSMTIPNSVTRIGNQAFFLCTGLATVSIGNSVTNIGSEAFAYCRSITSVTIPSSVISIGSGAFTYCTNLVALMVDAVNPAYSSVGGVLFDKNQTLLIQYPLGKNGSDYTIPGSVLSIGEGAFAYCNRLTNVAIGNGVTSIGNSAFSPCTNLVTVTIPNTVTSIGYGAFQWCSSLVSVTIGNGVSTIGNSAFKSCGNLATVVIGGTVRSIGNQAFAYCYSLKNITIPDSVVAIGEAAFLSCQSVTNVTIGRGVVSIGNLAFADMGWTIGLKRINFMGNAPTLLGSDVFRYDDYATVYYLPGTTGWSFSFGGRPTAQWLLPNPVILTFAPYFGVQTNRFGFRVSWDTNRSSVVEACTNLASPNWVPLATNITIPGPGWFYFSDPQWTNYPSRIYRIRSP